MYQCHRHNLNPSHNFTSTKTVLLVRPLSINFCGGRFVSYKAIQNVYETETKVEDWALATQCLNWQRPSSIDQRCECIRLAIEFSSQLDA